MVYNEVLYVYVYFYLCLYLLLTPHHCLCFKSVVQVVLTLTSVAVVFATFLSIFAFPLMF